jgi:hypothetical protein
MSDLCYCQYAFSEPTCRVQEIGSGVDPHFRVELIREGPIAAVVSRVELGDFSPERLQGKTAEDIQWLGKIAARHNEIICQAAASSAVLPLRLGTVFRSLESLQAMLVRCRSTVAEFLKRLGNRQEWGIKLYLEKRRPDPLSGHTGPPPPHFLSRQRGNDADADDRDASGSERRANGGGLPRSATSGTSYLTEKRAQLDSRREVRAAIHQTIQAVEQCLTSESEHYCRIRNLPRDLTGRSEEMVFNAALLLPSSAHARWLETIRQLDRDVQTKGLVLEVSGPWPPYHFCPNLEP